MRTTYAPNFIQTKPTGYRKVALIALAAIVFQLIIPGFAYAKTPASSNIHKTSKKQILLVSEKNKSPQAKTAKIKSKAGVVKQKKQLIFTKKNTFSLLGKIKTPSEIKAGTSFLSTISWEVPGDKTAENAELVVKIPKSLDIIKILPDATSQKNNVLRWSLGSLKAGSSSKKAPIQLRIAVPADSQPGSDIELIGQICAGSKDARKCVELTSQSVIEQSPKTPEPKKAVVVSNEPTDSRPDVSTKDAPILQLDKKADRRTAYPGETTTYSLIVKNVGLAPAKGVIVEDSLKAGFVYLENGLTTRTSIIGTLPPASSKTLTYKVVVGNDVKPGQYINTATASASNHKAVSDTAKIVIKRLAAIMIDQKPSLTIVKTVDRTSIQPGGVLAYKLTIRNNGQTPALNVKVTDHLPANFSYLDRTGASATWSIGDLLPNHERIINYDVRVSTEAVAGSVKNIAILTGDNFSSTSSQTTVQVQVGQVLGALASTGPGGFDLTVLAIAIFSIGSGYVLLRRHPSRLLTFRR